MRLVLCYPAEPRHVAQIQAAAPDWEVIDAGQERIAAELPTADIYCGHAKVPVPWEETVAAGRLQWIQSTAAGTDHCLVPCVVESQIPVTSASGVLADQVSEHTIALLTGLTRSLPTFFRAQQKREFIRRPTRDVHHSTIGIVGMGGVGRRLVQLLAPMKTRILATDTYPVDKPAEVAELWPAERLDDMLREIDILLLCAPLTSLTRGMIGRREIGLLREGTLLLNVARGPLVVEEALVEALESGHLAGAGLDVTEEEPLPSTSRLWEQPNLILTPHVGGQSARRIDDMTNFFCENVRRWRAGESLLNLVDKRLGYPVRKACRR